LRLPLLLSNASHSSFACGLRARLEEARNRSANNPLADCKRNNSRYSQYALHPQKNARQDFLSGGDFLVSFTP